MTRHLLMLLITLLPLAAAAQETEKKLSLHDMTTTALYTRYQDVLREKPGLGGPLAFTFGGLGASTMGAAAMFLAGSSCAQGPCVNAIGAGLLGAGLAFAAAGIAWWVHRSGLRDESDREMNEINGELALRQSEQIDTDDPDGVLPDKHAVKPESTRTAQARATAMSFVHVALYWFVPIVLAGLALGIGALRH